MIRKVSLKNIFFPLIAILLSFNLYAEDVTVVGTGDGVSILKAIGIAYSAQSPGDSISVPKSIGSGGGVKAIGKDQYLLGRVARGIKKKEQHFNLSYQPYAKIPVVFFVNKSVKITNLSTQQVIGIYTGKIRKWTDVGGNDLKVRVVRREDGDSSLSRLQKSFPGFKDIKITKKSKTTLSTPETIDTLESKKGSIGFGPYDVAKNSDVRILSIDGISPTDPSYPSVTTLGFVYKDGRISGAAKSFLEYATSPAAHATIIAAGGVSL